MSWHRISHLPEDPSAHPSIWAMRMARVMVRKTPRSGISTFAAHCLRPPLPAFPSLLSVATEFSIPESSVKQRLPVLQDTPARIVSASISLSLLPFAIAATAFWNLERPAMTATSRTAMAVPLSVAGNRHWLPVAVTASSMPMKSVMTATSRTATIARRIVRGSISTIAAMASSNHRKNVMTVIVPIMTAARSVVSGRARSLLVAKSAEMALWNHWKNVTTACSTALLAIPAASIAPLAWWVVPKTTSVLRATFVLMISASLVP